MMPVTLKIPSPLRRFTDNSSAVEVEADSVATALEQLFTLYPDLKLQVMDVLYSDIIILSSSLDTAEGCNSVSIYSIALSHSSLLKKFFCKYAPFATTMFCR